LCVRPLAVRVDAGVMRTAAHPLPRPDVEDVLRAAVARALALELAVGFLVGLRLLERRDLRLREDDPPPARLSPRAPSAASSSSRDHAAPTRTARQRPRSRGQPSPPPSPPPPPPTSPP